MSVSLDFEHFIGINAIPGAAKFHPNGEDYITAAGGNLICGSLTDPNKQDFLRAHNDRVTCISVSSSGSLLASGQCGDEANAYVWDYERKSILYTIEDHDGTVQDLAFSHDERLLATLGGDIDHKLIIWDISTGAIVASSCKVPTGTYCVTFGGFVKDIKRRDTDHYLLCTAGKDGLLMWDLNPYTGEFTPFRLAGDAKATITRTVTAVCFSDDRELVYGATTSGDFLVASMHTGTVYRVNISAMEHIVISEGHTQAITAVTYCVGQNDRFATASRDGTIRIWDTAEYVTLATCRPRRDQERGVVPLCLQYSDIILSGWSDGQINAFSDGGELLWMINNAHPGGVLAMTLSHNNRFILTGGPAGEVRLWELRTRDLISHLKEHVSRVTSLVLSEDDTFAITASRDRCILRWDLREEKRVWCHMQRMGGINGVVLAKDSSHIVSVGQEKKINYWGIESPDTVHSQFLDSQTPDGDEGRVVSISADGKWIATGGTAGVLRLFSYESSMLLSEAAGHSAPITSIAMSPDNKQIISVGEDGSIFFWLVFTQP
eukprot:GSChrysophyteH1.ASY1.ANO1.1739.1 assembled CDS